MTNACPKIKLYEKRKQCVVWSLNVIIYIDIEYRRKASIEINSMKFVVRTKVFIRRW